MPDQAHRPTDPTPADSAADAVTPADSAAVAAIPAESAAVAATPAGDQAGFRLAVFAAVLVVTLATGFGLGRVTAGAPRPTAGPSTAAGAPGQHVDPPGAAPHAHHADGSNVAPAAAGAEVGGVALSAGGFTLVPESTTFPLGVTQPLRFRVVGPARAPVTTFAVVHDKPLHLVVVRRDLTGYQHLHPTMAPDGTWSVDLTLPAAGSWRMYADFTAAAAAGAQTAVTLGADLTVPGVYQPAEPPPATTRADVAGLTVTYEGTPRTGATQPLLFRVTRAGAPVALQPYLGAYGHLVVLREGDLGYLHVHPEPQLVDGAVKFWVAAPSPGSYRMFLDVQVDGVVHTAVYPLTVR